MSTTQEGGDTSRPKSRSSISRAQKERQRIHETFRNRLGKVKGQGVFTLKSLSAIIGSKSSGQHQAARTFVYMAEVHPTVEVMRYFGQDNLQQFQFTTTMCDEHYPGLDRMRQLAERIEDASIYDTSIHGDAHELLTLLENCYV